LLVFWWIELYHRSGRNKSFLGGMKWVFIGVNAALYLFLLIVIIVYAATEGKYGVGICSTASRSTQAADTLAKVYKVFISLIALILAAGFMTYGLRLFLLVIQVAGSRSRITKFGSIAIICSVGLLLQCALLLYSTFKPASHKTNTALAISFTLVVEVLPGIILIAFMRQPVLQGLTWYQDLVWCLYPERNVVMPGTSNKSSYRSTKSARSNTGNSSAVRASGLGSAAEPKSHSGSADVEPSGTSRL